MPAPPADSDLRRRRAALRASAGRGHTACVLAAGLIAVVALAMAAPLALHARRPQAAASPRLNVLFIAVDDLRPETGAYGQTHMQTPVLDRLAREGRLFTRHYAQVPTCGASRYALLTGQLPVSAASQGNEAFVHYERGDAPPSLPEWFRRAGYATAQIGKISHSPDGRRLTQSSDGREGSALPEVPGAWEALRTPVGPWETAWRAFFAYAGARSRSPGQSPPTEMADVPDTAYPDGLIAAEAVRALDDLRGSDRPFFLAVGFFKPHLPFTAPARYWRQYDAATLPTPGHGTAPSGVDPAISLHRGGEFFGNYGHAAAQADDPGYARHLRHGYAAAVSYADTQIGTVLDALEARGLRDRTIVVVWGDHGYHLGDLGVWGKHTLHEAALRSALIVRTPALEQPGTPTDALASSVDLYPTLAALAGLPAPPHVDGADLRAVIARPDAPAPRDAALGLWRMNGYAGESLRTDRYRYTRWHDQQQRLAQVELYDHETDPHESRNVASESPAIAAALDARLLQLLDARAAARP